MGNSHDPMRAGISVLALVQAVDYVLRLSKSARWEKGVKVEG
jgi:hypothetical protein